MKVLLGPLLGHVTPDSARVWVRTSPATETDEALVVTSWSVVGGPVEAVPLKTLGITGGTGSVTVPLRGGPDVFHRIEVRTPGGVLLAEMPVRAAPGPTAEGRVAFAFGSCWLPDGGVPSLATWEILEVLARARHVDHLLLLGDQVYADELALERGADVATAGRTTAVDRVLALPPGAPLAERVGPYRDLYQQSWAHDVVQRVQARLPATFSWDDHEIVNGWGSARWHAEPRGVALFEAAAQAFEEFQGSRNPPSLVEGCGAHAFRRGPAAFLTLDLRTFRRADDGALLGDRQREAVEAWLAGPARESSLLFLVLSVPLLHLPVTLAPLRGVTDVLDQWSSAPNVAERTWVLELLRHFEEGGRRRAVIVGGDAHLATLASLTHGDGRRTWQVTSSPLSQRLPPVVRWALSLARGGFPVRVGDREARARIHRRWVGANVGVVRGEVRDGASSLSFEVFRPGRRTVAVRLD